MNQLITYLTFNGNCREAMSFYQNCLGGELHFQTIAESPMAEKFPRYIKNYILQAFLQKNNVLLMASDMVAEEGLKKGNSVSILIDCSSEQEFYTLYFKLSKGGQIAYPPQRTAWEEFFGGFTDKYGNHWLLQFK